MRHFACLAVLGLLICVPAGAAEGRIPIFEPIIIDGTATCDPMTSNCAPISGRYIVTNDIVSTDDASIIRVIGTGVEQVDIDLNGFTLTATSTLAHVIHATNVRTISVRNGTAVAPADITRNVIHVNFDTATSSIQPERGLVENMTILGGVNGIAFFSIRNFTIRNNAIIGTNFRHGISIDGLDSHGTIENNLIRDSFQHGMLVHSGIASVVIQGNQLEFSGKNGIHVAPGDDGLVIVAENSVRRSGLRGIFVNKTLSCRVSGNVVQESGVVAVDPGDGHGIFFNSEAHSCLVHGNTSSQNKNSGLSVQGSFNHLTGNVLNQNDEFGLVLGSSATSNTFGDNTARGNGSSAPTCTSPDPCPGLAAPDFCDTGTSNSSFETNLAPGPPAC